jgi:hypothetical protein
MDGTGCFPLLCELTIESRRGEECSMLGARLYSFFVPASCDLPPFLTTNSPPPTRPIWPTPLHSRSAYAGYLIVKKPPALGAGDNPGRRGFEG